MRLDELRQLWDAILARARKGRSRTSSTQWEAWVEERLPEILRARYGAEDVTLSEEAQERAVAQLLEAARDHGSKALVPL